MNFFVISSALNYNCKQFYSLKHQKMAKDSQFPHISNPNVDKISPVFQRQKFSSKKKKNNSHLKPRQLMQIIKNKKAYYEQKLKQSSSRQELDSQNEQNQIVFPLVINMKKQIEAKEDFARRTKYKIFSLEDTLMANTKIQDIYEQSEHSIIQKINASVQETQQTSSHSHSRHMRINTQNTPLKKQNNPLTTMNKKTFTNSKSLHKTFKIHPSIYKPPLLNHDQIKKQFERLCYEIPKKLIHRKEDELISIVKFLQDYNPFFSKMDKIIGICLFKICKIVKVAQNDIIFKVNRPIQSFYIILNGRIKLSNPVINLKRVCQAGQTISEQIIMDQKFSSQSCLHFPLQKGKALTQTYLLEITLQNYRKLKEQLTIFGYKIHFNQFQAQIKRNYIVKNMLRAEKNKF